MRLRAGVCMSVVARLALAFAEGPGSSMSSCSEADSSLTMVTHGEVRGYPRKSASDGAWQGQIRGLRGRRSLRRHPWLHLLGAMVCARRCAFLTSEDRVPDLLTETVLTFVTYISTATPRPNRTSPPYLCFYPLPFY